MKTKACSKCGQLKTEDQFSVRLDMRDGRRSECIQCIREANRRRYLQDAESRKAKQREWNAKNKEKKRASGKAWRLANPQKVAESHKKWERANPEKVKNRIKRWAINHPERIRQRAKRWRDNHPEKAREVARNGSWKTWNSPKGRLNGIISSAIRRTLKGTKSRRHWESLVGYNIDQLRDHLEKQFNEYMNWQNQGSYWEIDHKIPIKAFHFKTATDESFKKAWALDNLQPLRKSDNRHKSAKLQKPFQPCVALV